MAIHTRPGPVVADPDDLLIEHRGHRVLVKILNVGAYPQIAAFGQPVAGSSWALLGPLDGDVFSNDVDLATGKSMSPSDWIAKSGGAAGFVRTVVVPSLNAILSRVWAAEEPTEPPVSYPPTLQSLQTLIGALRVTKATDGTIRVDA